MITVGLFGKVVLADALLAPVADAVYADAAQATLLEAWVGTLAFSGQIFFDFAGYSTCAVGVALCFGFVLRRNFHYPYAAIGFSDFWQRWHVSLSTWLRDYLYIPLGGNRKGRRRTQVNLMLTMLLGGLWHGADWRFVAWGGLHGIYLMGERIIRNRWQGRTWENRWYVSLSLALLTHFLVLITWVFFRAADFHSAYLMLSAMFAGRSGLEMLSPLRVYSVLALTAGTLATHWLLRDTSLESVWATTPVWTRSAALAGLLISVMMAPGTERAFIYFQF